LFEQVREAFKSFPAQKKNCQALDYWQFLLTHRSARERLARHNFFTAVVQNNFRLYSW